MRPSALNALNNEINDPGISYRGLPWALVSANRAAHPTVRLAPLRMAVGVMNHDVPFMFAPSPLVRSASAPPDFIPPPPSSRTVRHHGVWTIAEDGGQSVVPSEVVETRRIEKDCSQGCLRCVVLVTTLRWLLVSIALLGAACVVVGIVFGVMSSTLDKGTLFVLSFTFIGLGIVLVVVVCIGWRCAPAGHEPCHDLCRLGRTSPDVGFSAHDVVDDVTMTSRAPELMTRRSRNQWYGGLLYPEFRYGTPPPSYITSTEQYHQRMQRMRMDAGGSSSIIGGSTITSLGNVSSLPGTPPPSYHSRITSRIRPSLNGLVDLHPSTGDLPPPYGNNSRRPSVVDVVNRVAEDTGGRPEGSGNPGNPSTNPDSSTVRIFDEAHNQVEYSVAELTIDDSQTAAAAAAAAAGIVVLDSRPEVPSVLSIVRCFENSSLKADKKYRTTKLENITEKFPSPQSNGQVGCSGVSGSNSGALNPAGTQVGPSEQSTTSRSLANQEDDASISTAAESSYRYGGSNLGDGSSIVKSAEMEKSEGAHHGDTTICFVGVSMDGSSSEIQRPGRRDLSRGQSLEDHDIGESGI